MSGPQYTSCVEPTDFKPFNTDWFWVAGILSLVIPPATAAALVECLYYYADWALNGKLICLYREQKYFGSVVSSGASNQICAIGEVGDFEVVGEDKNVIESIDNDYCINLILAPINLSTHIFFAKKNYNDPEIYDIAKAGMQGDLISAQNKPDMPTNDDGTLKYGGYARDFVMFASQNYENWLDIVGHNVGGEDAEKQNTMWNNYCIDHSYLSPHKYRVPVLHCEFEGASIAWVLAVINAFTFGGNWCKKNWFFGWICRILRWLLAPAILAAVLIAWNAAPAGSQSDALVDPAAGEVKPKDMVVMRGRWVYDGGHSGYNEMHAVRTLQKIYNVPCVSVDTLKATMQTYILILGKTVSDLGVDPCKHYYLETQETTPGLETISCPASETVTLYGFTRANIPDNAHWETAGITVEVYVSENKPSTDIYISVQADRIDSAGQVQESTTVSSEQQATSGLKIFSIDSKDWTAGDKTDRLGIRYIFKNTANTNISCDIRTGTMNDVKTSIKLPLTQIQNEEIVEFEKFRLNWCQLTGEAGDLPLGDYTQIDPGMPRIRPWPTTPEQEQVRSAQLRPENQWKIHPLLDGCEPDKSENPLIPR